MIFLSDGTQAISAVGVSRFLVGAEFFGEGFDHHLRVPRSPKGGHDSENLPRGLGSIPLLVLPVDGYFLEAFFFGRLAAVAFFLFGTGFFPAPGRAFSPAALLFACCEEGLIFSTPQGIPL